MTSQLLIPESPAMPVVAKGAVGANASEPTVEPSPSPASNPSVCAPVMKLPYQKTHQVELLNLQAETEALLQRLRVLKQQKSTEANSLTMAVAGE